MILARCAAPLASESLYREHVDRVARWVERLAGPTLDTEDIVHEVFAIAYERLSSFRGDSSLTTWLFSIADRVIRYRRRKERWRRWLSGSAEETAGELASPLPDPAREVERLQDTLTVYRVLDRLSERDRQIIILCEIEEMSADEVAELLDIEPGNARLRLHRARGRFLRVFEEFEQRAGQEGGAHGS